MGRYQRIPKNTVLKAIAGCGAITHTVAKRLDCDWLTAQRLINRWEETKEAFRAEGEQILDVAEGEVIKAVYSGDLQTSKWLLAKKGKERGYSDIPELPGCAEKPLNIRFTGGVSRDSMLASHNVEVGGDEE